MSARIPLWSRLIAALTHRLRPRPAEVDARHALGRWGEGVAERRLIDLGMRIVARRYRTPFGELDLVALDGETLVFVEVKTQSSRAASDPEQRLTPEKRARLSRAVSAFRAQRRWSARVCRFDLVTVVGEPGELADVAHYPDVFVPSRA